ncbi:hypothetical protein EUU23_09400 [Sphingorhabdus sp. IMCC26285]|uniref:Uncharacterized protein n=1 Tax=Sphingorhabdus profundilacus TaxID=2509718 RepID=A0A6I4LXZ6_9SPHN|nr:hypothetical protein [Sphingorhabdus profundilacus]MVZ97921.1 hypothetical protein [Sphingorhabdus profundilacus]
MAWSGAILGCQEATQPERKFDITLRRAANTWQTTDPKGVLSCDAGTFDLLAGIAACHAGSGELILKILGLDGLAIGTAGAGTLADGAPITWECVELQ